MNKKDLLDFLNDIDIDIDDEMDRLLDESDRYATMLYRTEQLDNSDTLSK